MIKELQALEMYLVSIIEQRAAIRKEYIERDKELVIEIKEVLNRIRAIEESAPSESKCMVVESTEDGNTAHTPEELDNKTPRIRNRKYNYAAEVVPKAISILQESGDGLRSSEIIRLLKEKHNLEFSNPTVAINRIMSLTNRIKKENKRFYYANNEE
ncbi:hypothetical protein [Brevibacillus sp. 179-C9.3 HS]|uniref:Rok-like winged helix domain-containing protein n=1 Tax=unclassified Brevibacillus TaxID=2684853 RepID=UPI0039A33806